MTGLRPLPRPTALIEARPLWTYPTPGRLRGGRAHLTLWSALHAADVRGFLAVATETGTGLTITNSMEHIWHLLRDRYCRTGQPLTLLEHYPPGAGADQREHLDEAWVATGPRWRRIWPTSPANPDHDLLSAWADEHVTALLTAARAAAT